MQELIPTRPAQERILEFAFHAFAQKGYKALALDEIAKELHISKKTIYKFFSSKEDLLGASLNHGLHRFESRLHELETRNPGGSEHFVQLCTLFTDFHAAFAAAVRAEIATEVPHLEERINLFEALMLRKAFSRLLKSLRGDFVIDYPSPTRELVDSWCESLKGLAGGNADHLQFIARSFYRGMVVKEKKRKKGK